MKDSKLNLNMVDLLNRATNHDQQAIATLYQSTFGEVFCVVKSLIRDEDAVFDLVQDTYMKAFTHLDQLHNAYQFAPWVKQIAANTARDWLKRQRPLLFSEMMEYSEQEYTFEERIADQDLSHMPEVVLDQAETERLMREIYDALPEDQRVVIGMFYYEELPVREIARLLGISESAVKSRLLYGRKKIKERVLDLEKKGTKLYGLAPILLLLLLLRSEEVHADAMPQSGQILRNVLNHGEAGQKPVVKKGMSGQGGRAANMGRAAKATKAGSGFAIHSVGAAVAAGVSVGLVVAGILGTVIYQVVDGSFEHKKDSNTEIAAEKEKQEEDQSLEALSQELAAVSDEVSETESESDAEADREVAGAESQETEEVNLYTRYTEILDHVENYDFQVDSYSRITGYEYALVPMEKDDELETLLVGAILDTEGRHIRLFQYVPSEERMIQPEGPDNMIVITNILLAKMEDGHGLSYTESTGRGAIYDYRIWLEDENLQYKEEASFMLGDGNSGPNTLPIEWYPISDRSILGENTMLDKIGRAGTGELPTDGNRLVLTGTLKEFTYDEVVSWQGMPDPNAGWTSTDKKYYILTFDEEKELALRSGDGSPGLFTQRARGIVLPSENISNIIDLNKMNQELIFSIDPDNTYWPSDTSLPLFQPSTRDIRVLS